MRDPQHARPMSATLENPNRTATSGVSRLPSRMKVLYITTLHRTGGWLAEAFASDSATHVHLSEAVGVTAGMAQLRSEVFDAILVSHDPQALDAFDLVEGLRAGGTEEPIIVLGAQSEPEMAPFCFEVGADGYCCVGATTVRALIWLVARAIERFQLVRENRRLLQADRQRLDLEHQEAQRLLNQQRSLIAQLQAIRQEATCGPNHVPPPGIASAGAIDSLHFDAASFFATLPPQLVAHYREMLRAYVIMGAGNLSEEMAALASLLATAGVTSRETMQLHLHVLEELVRGLGNRSARHVMNRADLLILEVMVHLAEGYRRQYLQKNHPPRQLPLPGFTFAEGLRAAAASAVA
jgi:DNA-binding response OmpR family regulator